MRAVLCITLILVCLMTVAAQRSTQLYGYVRYSDNSAAKGVVVGVGDFNVITNNAGYYKVASVSSGDNAVLITPPGKATKSFTVTVGSGPTEQDFKIDW